MTKQAHHHEHGEHHHGHHHEQMTYGNAFCIAIVANSLFVILQVIYACLAHSTSLLADAFHNLGDVLGLVLAWIASGLMKRKPTARTTYGLKKTSILAALFNGALLVFTCGIIATQAVYKLIAPTDIHALSVMLVAAIGIVVNGSTALLFLRGSDDLNIRGAYLHLFYDALISVGVVVSAVILYYTNWLWIDPLVGLLISLVILKGTWALFSDSFRLIIDGVPKSIAWTEVNRFLLAKAGVEGIHDLHIWAMSTQENALSVHVYMPEEVFSDTLRLQWVDELNKLFGIQHVTIQIERTEVHCKDSCYEPFKPQ
jgi:cobalt-zinc-cadmium efflux system protein